MVAAQVLVTVDENGKVTVETAGVKGPACEKLSSAIEAVLGVSTANTRKPEYLLQPDVVQPQNVAKGN